jgi:nucleotidyltransferase substrate binding protein (TIGR01987 family)
MSENRSLLSFKKALRNLERSTATPAVEPRDLSGIIKDFEMTYELSWKVLKKILREAGHETLGAKDVYTKAFQLGYLETEQPWLAMIQDRNSTTHVYDEKDARKISDRIKASYLPALQSLEKKIASFTP